MSTTQLSCTLHTGLYGNMRPSIGIIDGLSHRIMMPDSKVLPKLSAYVDENKLKVALEVVP